MIDWFIIYDLHHVQILFSVSMTGFYVKYSTDWNDSIFFRISVLITSTRKFVGSSEKTFVIISEPDQFCHLTAFTESFDSDLKAS